MERVKNFKLSKIITKVLIISFLVINLMTTMSHASMTELVNEAKRIAKNNKYTYSQSNRNGKYQYDCSSLVHRLFKKYLNVSTPNCTINYKKSSKYYVGSPKNVKLKTGDVLWRGSYKNGKWHGHVTIYIGGGYYVAAHKHYSGNSAKDITVYKDSKSNYTRVYRFTK